MVVHRRRRGHDCGFAALILVLDTWGALTIPLAVLLLLSAVVTLALGRDDRPWGPQMEQGSQAQHARSMT